MGRLRIFFNCLKTEIEKLFWLRISMVLSAQIFLLPTDFKHSEYKVWGL